MGASDDCETYECPYECAATFADPPERLAHMWSAHPEETRTRRDVLAKKIGESWKARAACTGYEMVFEPNSRARTTTDRGAFRKPTPREAAAISLCASCPVRAECAEASVNAPPVVLTGPELMDEGGRHNSPPTYEPLGIWAGVRDFERKRVVAELGHGAGAVSAILAIGERMVHEYPGDVSRLWRIGEEPRGRRKMARFGQGKPGPGRGHVGPIGIYARTHGVSRSTAWRRLKEEKAA